MSIAKYDSDNKIQITGYLVDLFRLTGRPRVVTTRNADRLCVVKSTWAGLDSVS